MTVTAEIAKKMYLDMWRIRHFEEEANRQTSLGSVQGAVHMSCGEEGVAVGVCSNLRDDDYITGTHRSHGHCLAKGASIDAMMAELFGKATGSCSGKGGSMHIADLSLNILGANGIVAGGIGPATGAGLATRILAYARPRVEALDLPEGYTTEWWGEYKSTSEAQASLAGGMPVFILLMIVTVIVLFNSLKQPLVIWLNVPLALIGVTFGLLVTDQPFGFMSILGFLSLMGMLIKNAIVLIDQINVELAEGSSELQSVVHSCASRLRPVAMAASTTALGMIPLVFDAFFSAMAVTIIFGLLFATLLTMVILPVFYSIVFNIKMDESA